MSERLKSKNIIVTAAGQGIGKATAIAFHNEGANVIATDLNDKTLADLNKEFPDIHVKTLDNLPKIKEDISRSRVINNFLEILRVVFDIMDHFISRE